MIANPNESCSPFSSHTRVHGQNMVRGSADPEAIYADPQARHADPVLNGIVCLEHRGTSFVFVPIMNPFGTAWKPSARSATLSSPPHKPDPAIVQWRSRIILLLRSSSVWDIAPMPALGQTNRRVDGKRKSRSEGSPPRCHTHSVPPL